MPSYPHRGALKAAIVARVAAGETVAAICAGDPAMPSADSVRGWARGDAGFAAELAGARARGAFARGLMFREEVAAAFLARVAAGETVRSLLGKPGMPSQRAYIYWRRTEVGFQATLWRLRGARYGRQAGVAHRRWRAWDPAVADAVFVAVAEGTPLRALLASRADLPCLAVVGRWRREHPEWDRMLRMAMQAGRLTRGSGRPSPELVEEIGDRIMLGASLRELGAQADMPCARTLYVWMRRWPQFEAEVLLCSELRDDWFAEQMLAICERNGPFGLEATKREAAPLRQQLNRLAKRPGWRRGREDGCWG
jgi:hypothetical protein